MGIEESHLRYINIAMNAIVAAVIFVLIIAAGKNKVKTRSLNKSYIPLMAVTFGSTLADLFGWYANGNPAAADFVFICNALFYIFNFAALGVSAKYLISYLGHKTDPPHQLMWLVNSGCVIGISVVAVNFFTPILFIVNDAGVYERLDNIFFGLTQILGLMCMAICAAVVIRFNRVFRKDELFIFVIGYTILPIAALCVQAVVYGITVINISYGAFGLLMYFNSHRELAKRICDAKAAAAESRSNELQTRIFERFLFGFITPVRELIEYSPDKAFEAVNRLLEFKKHSQIEAESYSLIPFEQELKQAKSYAELAKICYGEGFEFLFDTPFTNFKIPPMTVIPLLENAAVHGLSEAESGSIRVKTAKTPEGVTIEITDNGNGFDPAALLSVEKSVFIVNERLRSLCGGDLNIVSTPGKGTVVTVIIKSE
jgi:hypothetical protein